MSQRHGHPDSHPSSITLGMNPSFGFGDRLGLATPGHVAALNRSGSGVSPIFPQQSIREMARTGRTPRQVMDDAMIGMREAGWVGGTGADADHLKTAEDVDATVAVGFTFFTIDPSDHVDPHADRYDRGTLRDEYNKVADVVDWLDRWKNRSQKLATGTTIEFDETTCMRAVVKYGRAARHSVELARHIAGAADSLGQDHEIELSVDETDQPTTLAEHYLIADHCLRDGVRLVSLAPRYLGDFEKGVDYKGNIAELERSLYDHASIAKRLGPYKLSLHSGSDKLSIYAPLARATRGLFHVKTAGTSYLEALRVVARHDEDLFRRVITFARDHYERDRATYHVSATLGSAPPATEVATAEELEDLYLERWPGVAPGRGFTKPARQILHCTFGSVLTDPSLGPAVKQLLADRQATYTEVLADHFSRHIDALKVGM